MIVVVWQQRVGAWVPQAEVDSVAYADQVAAAGDQALMKSESRGRANGFCRIGLANHDNFVGQADAAGKRVVCTLLKECPSVNTNFLGPLGVGCSLMSEVMDGQN